jgi:hypothetical protein
MRTRTGQQPNTVSITSPLAITMLLHFHAICEPYINAPVASWPNAQRAILGQFLAHGLVQAVDHGYMTAPKGDKIVRKLLLQFQLLTLDI